MFVDTRMVFGLLRGPRDVAWTPFAISTNLMGGFVVVVAVFFSLFSMADIYGLYGDVVCRRYGLLWPVAVSPNQMRKWYHSK